MNGNIFYPSFAGISLILALILIPKNQYKKFFVYGLIFGGIGDGVIGTLHSLLGLIDYKNMGMWDLFGITSIWTLITWAFNFMIFFYFLPREKTFLYLYILAFVGLSYGVGLVMQNMGLFEYIGLLKFLAPVVFLAWYSFAAYVFLKREAIKLT